MSISNKKNTHTTCAKQKSNKNFIAKKKQKQNKVMIRNIPKIGVEKTKTIGNSTSIYTYWVLVQILKTFNLNVAYVHPCVPMYKL